MLAKRIIPCLDVEGRPGGQGRQLRQPARRRRPGGAGAVYDAEGADELVFLDITACHEGRDIIARHGAPRGREVFIPFTVGGGIRTRGGHARDPAAPGRTRSRINTAAVRNARAHRRGAPSASAASASWWPSTPSGDGSSDGWEVYIHGGRMPTGLDAVDWAQRGRAARRGRDPAHQHGPRRHRGRLRPAADRAPSPTRSASR